MLHGGLGSIDLFGPSPALRAAGRQIIAVDLHGHGRTPLGDRPISLIDMGNDMAVLLERLGYRQVDAIGYSLGAGVAFRLAVQHPELVRRLVLVSAGFRQDGFYAEMIAQQAQMSGAMADRMKETPMYQSYATIAPHPEDFPRLLDRMGELMRQPYDYEEDAKACACRSCSSTATATCSGPSTWSSSTTCWAAACATAAGCARTCRRTGSRSSRSDALRHLHVSRPGAHRAAVPERGDGCGERGGAGRPGGVRPQG